MIIIINGSVGVGKTSVSLELQKKFKKSIMLDGDYIGAVHPFELYEQARIEYLYDTIYYLFTYHFSNGFENFIINYVFESAQSLDNLLNRFKAVNLKIKCYWLISSIEEQKERITLRSRGRKDWELKRLYELNQILENASKIGFIGEKVEIQGKTVKEVTDLLWNKVQQDLI
ncbi:hypothetical protein [Lutibacter sp.]